MRNFRLAFAAFTLLALPAMAETIVNGGEVGGQTWSPAGSPYRIKGDITIAAGTTLRMLPGTDVLVYAGDLQAAGIDPTAVEITVRGELIAENASIASFYDTLASQFNDFWHGIVVEPQATRVSITGSYLQASYAGITYRHPGSILDVAGTTISNFAGTIVRVGNLSRGVGVRVESGVPLIERATIWSGGVVIVGSGRPRIRSSRFSSYSPIDIHDTDGTATPIGIFNNTIDAFQSAAINIVPPVAGLSVEIANNAIRRTEPFDYSITVGAIPATVNIHHNMFDGILAYAVSGTVAGYYNFAGAGADGIDRGTNAVDVPTDLEGRPRPQGLAMDIGATESVGTTNRLFVSVAGLPGSVTSTPLAIDCGATCDAIFYANTVVTLSAAPNGSRFAGWSGACTGTGPCVVTMDAWKNVVATFATIGPARGDVNGDGKADLFWREAAPGVGLSWWTMNGAAVTGANYFEVPSEWQVADVGDFNGDGKVDLVWRRAADGATYLWTLDGLAPVGFFDLGILSPSEWTLVGTADLDGDGKSDLVWRSSTGVFYFWLMNGGAIASQGGSPSIGAEWQVVDLADMNGDGKSDIVFRNTTTGEVYIWFMNGLVVASQSGAGGVNPASWTLVAVADFNGDGKSDFLWKSTAGEVVVWMMNGATPLSSSYLANVTGPEWSIKSVGDFDGDGKADILWRRTDGATDLWKIDGLLISHGSVPNPGVNWQIVAP